MIRGGSRISFNGKPVSHYNVISCYSQYSVLDERSLIKLPTGVMVAIEFAGRADTLKEAYEATSRGGTTVTVGLPPASSLLSISALSLVSEVKTICGSHLGSANPHVDFPEFVNFWRSVNLPVEKLLTSVSPMDQGNDAMDALQGAQVVRQVIHPH